MSSAGSAYAVDKALGWLNVPPGNDPDAFDEVLAEWSKLVGVVTAAADGLDAEHPIAVQLRAAAGLIELDLGRWREDSRVDDVEHAELERTVQRFAARIEQGEAFDEERWELQAWWERAREASRRWLRNAQITERHRASVVLALTSAALESIDPRALHDVLAAYLPGNHIRTIPLSGGDQLVLDVGHVALHGWLAERLTCPDAVDTLKYAFQTLEDPTAPEVPSRLLLRDGLPEAVAVLRAA